MSSLAYAQDSLMYVSTSRMMVTIPSGDSVKTTLDEPTKSLFTVGDTQMEVLMRSGASTYFITSSKETEEGLEFELTSMQGKRYTAYFEDNVYLVDKQTLKTFAFKIVKVWKDVP